MSEYTSNRTGCIRETSSVGAQQVTVTVLDVLIFITGGASHALVVWILLKRQQNQHRHGTTILLLNLSAADALQLACLPFNVTAIAMQAWVFGDFLCRLISFTGVACSCASVFTLVALAINRYISILWPSKAYRFRKDWYLALVLASIWLPSLGLASPEFVYRMVEPDVAYCFAFLSGDSEVTFCVALFLCAFAVPLAIIAAMYAKILRYLGSRKLEQQTSSLHKYNTQVSIVSILLVVAFTTCWLPSYILMFLLIRRQASMQGAFPAVAWVLASSSTIVNPVIYLFTSEQFRKDLRDLLVRQRLKCQNKVGPASLDIHLPVTEQSQAISLQVPQSATPQLAEGPIPQLAEGPHSMQVNYNPQFYN